MRVETCFSAAGCEIVASPFLVGEAELGKLALTCSEDWIKSLPADVIDPTGPAPVSLEILNGGKFYYCQSAWTNVYPDNPCGVLKLRARRGHASGETYGGPANNDKDLEDGMELYQSEGSDWCVRLWEIPDELGLTGPVLVGDTIGTGTTLAGVLGWLTEKMVAAGSVQDIHVFTIAGAAEWDTDGGVVKKLTPIDEALAAHGKQLTVTFCNARYALQSNGTDLCPCPEMGAAWVPEALEIVKEKVGDPAFLKQLKCAVWDWGDRFDREGQGDREGPKHHLTEIKEYFEGQDGCPQYILEGIETRLAAL
jgi:hypothetical protein